MNKKRLKSDYKSLLHAVKLAIDEWNQFGLLPDAPSDEFDQETAMIVARIKSHNTIIATENIAIIVFNVFSEQFGSQDFPVDDCYEVAHNIRLNLDKITFRKLK